MPIRRFTFTRNWIPGVDLEAFAIRLRDARKAHGMSQYEFSRKMGVSTNSVSSWENARSQPMPEKMPKIASVLDVTEKFLKTGTSEGGAADNATDVSGPFRSSDIEADLEHLRSKIALAIGLPVSQVGLSIQLLTHPNPIS